MEYFFYVIRFVYIIGDDFDRYNIMYTCVVQGVQRCCIEKLSKSSSASMYFVCKSITKHTKFFEIWTKRMHS